MTNDLPPTSSEALLQPPTAYPYALLGRLAGSRSELPCALCLVPYAFSFT